MKEQRKHLNKYASFSTAGKARAKLFRTPTKEEARFFRVSFKMCIKKTTFRSFAAARERANQIEREDGPKMRVYHCPACGCYHLTSKLREHDTKVSEAHKS